jgi:hypothetical protein
MNSHHSSSLSLPNIEATGTFGFFGTFDFFEPTVLCQKGKAELAYKYYLGTKLAS